MRCFVLPYRLDDGPANMALDEALLEAAAAEPGTAYLRTYGWRPPTLSLGYFQRASEAGPGTRWEGLPRVRRPTGGGAIWHEHELTYAIVVPGSHPFTRPNTTLYRAVHGAVLEVLRGLGLKARREGDPTPLARDATVARSPFLCFTDRDPEDIVIHGAKVVGSAQRRRRGAILQHGSILLRRSTTTPELPGVCEFLGLPGEARDWLAPVEAAIAAKLALEREWVEVPDGVRRLARDLEDRCYRDPDWTARR
jgi:lipoate-protein ligase A